MLHLEYARKRLRAFLAQINDLLGSEFPYPQSKVALQRLRLCFEERLSDLEASTDAHDPATVRNLCVVSLTELFDYLPILGFLLRSTNVRNAFETFYPLLRLAREILESDVAEDKRTTELIISSEWDYSPLAYSRIKRLPGFILIGLPAPESQNPLLIPLAGHELGHSVWAKHHLGATFTPAVKKAVIKAIMSPQRWKEYAHVFPGLVQEQADLIGKAEARRSWSQAVDWALDQAEESFCDFLGVRVFGRSYLCAFGYLLAPKHSGQRSLHYPKMRTRVKNLIRAAERYHVSTPSKWDEMFEDEDQPALREGDSFRLSVSDIALSEITERLIEKADKVVLATKVLQTSEDEVNRIAGYFKRAVPAEKARSLADILNAAWQVSEDLNLWEDVPQIAGRREKKEEALRELVLKNIEVFEYERVLKENQ